MCYETDLLIDGNVVLERKIGDGDVFEAPFVEEFDGSGGCGHYESARRDVDLKRNGSCVFVVIPCF